MISRNQKDNGTLILMIIMINYDLLPVIFGIITNHKNLRDQCTIYSFR